MASEKKMVLNKKNLFRMLILFTVFEPQLLVEKTYAHMVCSMIRLIIGSIYMMSYIRKNRVPTLFLGLMPYACIAILSEVFNKQFTWSGILPEMIGILCTAVILSRMLQDSRKQTIEALYGLFWVYIIVNLIYMIVNPWVDVYNAYGFLGGKNGFGPIGLAMILVALLRYRYVRTQYEKIRCIELVFLVVIECLWLSSTTGIIGIFLFLCGTVFLRYIGKEKKIFRFLYIAQWIINYLVVIVNIQERMANMLYQLMGKDISFSGRTNIWRIAFNYINQRWFVGYGKSNIIRMYRGNAWVNMSAHNGVMDILIIGGVILLLAYEGYTCFCAAHAEKQCNRTAQICVWAWFVFRIMLLVEYYQTSAYFVLIMSMMFYSKQIEEICNEEIYEKAQFNLKVKGALPKQSIL